LFSIPTLAIEDEKPFLVGFAQDNMAGVWRAQQVLQLEKALQKYPKIKFIFTDAKGQAAKFVSDIEDLYDQGVDVLVVSPSNPALATPIISKIYNSGTPVVLITRKIKGDDYTTFIAPDDREIAKLAADAIADSLGGKGNVLMVQGLPNATTVIDRTLGFEEQLKKYKGVKIAAIGIGNYDRADAIKAVGDALEKGIKFDAIYAQSDSMAVGARIAMRVFGMNPENIPIVGIDYDNDAREAIIKGTQTVSFTYPTCAKEASIAIWDILQGKEIQKRIRVQSQKITLDNVNSVKIIF
jgi:ribose transport system substrate-binding protein